MCWLKVRPASQNLFLISYDIFGIYFKAWLPKKWLTKCESLLPIRLGANDGAVGRRGVGDLTLTDST